MKLKASGAKRSRNNVRGFEQIPGIHYDPDGKASPVVNKTTIRIMFMLACSYNKPEDWLMYMMDIKGAFLKGRYKENEKKVVLEVPQGFRHMYSELGREMLNKTMTVEELKQRMIELHEYHRNRAEELREKIKQERKKIGGCKDVLLRLMRTMYGQVNAAKNFWIELLAAMKHMKCVRSAADPCLYFKWVEDKLLMWISWVDDCVAAGVTKTVVGETKKMKQLFECDDIGKMNEFIGCGVHKYEDGSIRLTQPVLIQSFKDEFGAMESNSIRTPALVGQVLERAKPETAVGPKEHALYRSGVGKLIYLSNWSRPEMLNAVRELTRQVRMPSPAHIKAMIRAMNYAVSTPERGILFKSVTKWDGTKKFVINIGGESDSTQASCPDTMKSVSGNYTTINDIPIITRSFMQDTVKLSVTESELESAVTCAQDMMFVKELMESMGFEVQLPMVLKTDNQGVKDIANGWSIGGRTRHIQTKCTWIRELVESEILKVDHINGLDMTSDLFTKNLPRRQFEKHAKKLCGTDKYMLEEN